MRIKKKKFRFYGFETGSALYAKRRLSHYPLVRNPNYKGLLGRSVW